MWLQQHHESVGTYWHCNAFIAIAEASACCPCVLYTKKDQKSSAFKHFCTNACCLFFSFFHAYDSHALACLQRSYDFCSTHSTRMSLCLFFTHLFYNIFFLFSLFFTNCNLFCVGIKRSFLQFRNCVCMYVLLLHATLSYMWN